MSLQGGSNQSGTVESFTYNLQNQLTGYQSNKTTASYAYGANGLRKSKTVGNVTTKFVWDRGNVSSEQVGNDTTVYNYGSDGIAARKTSSKAKIC